jgi:hypothetical protein
MVGFVMTKYQWKAFTGRAVCEYANGDRYEGEVASVQPHGQGLMYFANGDRYEGQFQFGKFNGSGTYTFKKMATVELGNGYLMNLLNCG